MVWAEWIAWQLEAEGYQVVVQAWDFRAGSDFVQQMHQVVQEAKQTIAVLSPAYLTSAFGAAEWGAVFAEDPRANRVSYCQCAWSRWSHRDCSRPGCMWTWLTRTHPTRGRPCWLLPVAPAASRPRSRSSRAVGDPELARRISHDFRGSCRQSGMCRCIPIGTIDGQVTAR